MNKLLLLSILSLFLFTIFSLGQEEEEFDFSEIKAKNDISIEKFIELQEKEIPKWIKALASGNLEEKIAAMQELEKLSIIHPNPEVITRYLTPEVQQLFVNQLVEILQDNNLLVRAKAALVLARRGQDKLAFPIFMEVISKKECELDSIKMKVLEAMESMEEKAAPSVPILLRLLADEKSYNVQYLAARVLKSTKESMTPFLPILVRISNDEVWDIARPLLEQLGNKAMPVIMEILRDEKEKELVKIRVIWVLEVIHKQINDDEITEAIPYLIQAIKWGGCRAGQGREHFLRCLSEERTPALINVLVNPNHVIEKETIRILADAGELIVPTLIETLDNHPQSQVRAKILKVLASMDNKAASAIPALIKACECKDINVSKEARKALGQIAYFSLPEMDLLLQNSQLPKEVRSQIQSLMEEVKKTIPQMINDLSNSSPWKVERAADRLRYMGKYAVPAIFPLIKVMSNKDCTQDVRAIIKRTLITLREVCLEELEKSLQNKELSAEILSDILEIIEVIRKHMSLKRG